MKRPGLLLPLCAATLFLGLPALGHAADAAMARSGPRQQELLARFDRNHDGKLDDDERADAKEAMLQEQLERQAARSKALPGGAETFRAMALALFDRDGDGQLDETERAAAEKFAETYRGSPGLTPEAIKRFDRDANGRFDDEERAALEAHLRALPRATAGRGPAAGPFGNPELRRELLQRFDRNADGRIEGDEVRALETALRPRIEQTPAQLRRFDGNADGKLDDSEWSRARTILLAWLNASPTPNPALPPPPREAVSESDAERWATHFPNPPPAPPEMSDAQRRADADARLKAVADEIARRRIEAETRAGGK